MYDIIVRNIFTGRVVRKFVKAEDIVEDECRITIVYDNNVYVHPFNDNLYFEIVKLDV